jgi:hypothetical protein
MGPGHDGVLVTASIEATSHMNHLVQFGSLEATAFGGKVTGYPPLSCRGGVVQQLGAGQPLGPSIAAGDYEDLDRDTAPSASPALPVTAP